MKEFNNRNTADRYAEYITSPNLRRLVASKVAQYTKGEAVTVYDCAAGSGQLEQFVTNMSGFHACEIQPQACEALMENYPTAVVFCGSLFHHLDYDGKHDVAIANPPFSMKLKDITEMERANIQAKYPWKRSGVVDDIFMLEALSHARRCGVFIMFPGVCYRGSERKMREIVGNRLAEYVHCEKGFEDTSIAVALLVIDQDKTTPTYRASVYDCKTETETCSEELLINAETWSHAVPKVEKEEINIVETHNTILKASLDRVEYLWEIMLLRHQDFNEDISEEVDDLEKGLREIISNIEKFKQNGNKQRTTTSID